MIPEPDSLLKHDTPSHDADTELTVKLHLVGSASSAERVQWVHEALTVLQRDKGLEYVDTLLLGFRGVDYKGKATARPQEHPEPISEVVSADVEAVWEGVVAKYAPQQLSNGTTHTDPFKADVAVNPITSSAQVKALGTLYLPLDLLKRLSTSAVPPRVNSMDTPDCHHLPKEYTEYAAKHGIELWAGGGGEGSGELHTRGCVADR